MPANSTASISGTGTTWYDADYFAFSPLSGVTINDTNPSAIDTVTITLTVAGVPTDASGKLSGTNLTKIGVGVYKLAAASPQTLTAELDALVFTPTDGQVPLGHSVTTGVTIAVTDNGLTATDATTAINVTAENPYVNVVGSNGAPGVAGVLSGRGGGTRAVTATAYSLASDADVNPAQDSYAFATGGDGGAGANATSAHSNAGSGGAGGGATATATLVSTVPSAYEDSAQAIGGNGGAGGQNSFAAQGGNGGNGGGATATAFANTMFGSDPSLNLFTVALAASTGGTGGTASGSGATGGAGGEVYGTNATVESDNTADAFVYQYGGDGGAGAQGANGGAGAASELVNAVSILASGEGAGGAPELFQNAQGGVGGDSDTGHGGNGGLAISDLTVDYAANPAVASDLVAYVIGTGGDGGNGAIGGNGGPSWDAATIKAAGSVYVETVASGGSAGANGLAGGDAQAKATAIGTSVQVEADAFGGYGQTMAGIGNAAATGTGASGTVVANTASVLDYGNLITEVGGSASAVVDGTNTALSQAGIGTTQPSNPGGAIAYIDALPVAAYAARAEAGAPHTIAAMGATPDILATGELGGAHSTQGTDSQISTASVVINIDLLQLTSTPDLFLGFYNVSGSSSGITDISLSFTFPNGENPGALDFSSTAAAKAALNDNPIEIGSLFQDPYSAGPPPGSSITLSVTTDHAGSAFSAYFVLGHG